MTDGYLSKGDPMNRARMFGILLIACLVISLPATAMARVKIKEIVYNSPGSDTGSNKSLNAEWVQLHNTASHSVKLTGWRVRDAAGHVYKFGTFRLGAGGNAAALARRHGPPVAQRV